MDLKIIKSEIEYDAVLARIDELFDAKPNSKEHREVELLMGLVELYEQEYYKIEAPDSINEGVKQKH